MTVFADTAAPSAAAEMSATQDSLLLPLLRVFAES